MELGHFIPFLVRFKDKSGALVPAEGQAMKVISKVREILKKGAQGVAILYSANYRQTQLIQETYASNQWKTGVNGSNQAAVVHCVEQLIDQSYKELQGKFRVAPITTMTYDHYDGLELKEVVVADLEKIRTLLDEGWYVLGWMNQETQPHYAIGGGVSGVMDPDLKDMIQRALAEFAIEYSM